MTPEEAFATLLAVAARQRSLVTIAQAHRLGVGQAELDQLDQQRRLTPVCPGVFAVRRSVEPMRYVYAYACWLALRPEMYAWERSGADGDLTADAVISHESAATVFGLGSPSLRSAWFTVPAPLPELPRSVHVRVAALRPDEVILHEGLPVTTVHRTILDLVGNRTDPVVIQTVMTDAVRLDLVDLGMLYNDLRPLAATHQFPADGHQFICRFLPHITTYSLSERNQRAVVMLAQPDDNEPRRNEVQRLKSMAISFEPGGNNDDFWRTIADHATDDTERERLALDSQYERLYSAAAHLLAAFGSSLMLHRARRWRELEAVLTEYRSPAPDEGPDPSRQLLFMPSSATSPVNIADAVQEWERRLRAPAEPAGQHSGFLVLPEIWFGCVAPLISELRHRLAPGRPTGAVGTSAAELSAIAHKLADQLRAPMTGRRTTPHPALSLPAPPSLRISHVRSEDFERLVTSAGLAAGAAISQDEHPEVATAAADLMTTIRHRAQSGWRELRDGIRPERDLVSTWDPEESQPVGLYAQALDLATTIDHSPLPWLPTSLNHLPETGAESRLIVLPAEAALIIADLLDELAVRLQPGRWIGTIHISTLSFQRFVDSSAIGAALRRGSHLATRYR